MTTKYSDFISDTDLPYCMLFLMCMHILLFKKMCTYTYKYKRLYQSSSGVERLLTGTGSPNSEVLGVYAESDEDCSLVFGSLVGKELGLGGGCEGVALSTLEQSCLKRGWWSAEAWIGCIIDRIETSSVLAPAGVSLPSDVVVERELIESV